ncbi:TetR/AcrR family transcriptional regulator C-terminal domain-containing protein [Prauserella oleivorans]
MWETYRRHPWVLRVQITAPPVGPGQLAWFDAGLRPLRKAGLDGGDQVSVLLFLLGAVRQLALISIDVEHGREQAGLTPIEAETDYDAALREFVDPERFPALTALVNEGAFTPSGRPDAGVDLDLQFGVRRVLDGIEAYVLSRDRKTGTTSAAERLKG